MENFPQQRILDGLDEVEDLSLMSFVFAECLKKYSDTNVVAISYFDRKLRSFWPYKKDSQDIVVVLAASNEGEFLTTNDTSLVGLDPILEAYFGRSQHSLDVHDLMVSASRKDDKNLLVIGVVDNKLRPVFESNVAGSLKNNFVVTTLNAKEHRLLRIKLMMKVANVFAEEGVFGRLNSEKKVVRDYNLKNKAIEMATSEGAQRVGAAVNLLWQALERDGIVVDASSLTQAILETARPILMLPKSGMNEEREAFLSVFESADFQNKMRKFYSYQKEKISKTSRLNSAINAADFDVITELNVFFQDIDSPTDQALLQFPNMLRFQYGLKDRLFEMYDVVILENRDDLDFYDKKVIENSQAVYGQGLVNIEAAYNWYKKHYSAS